MSLGTQARLFLERRRRRQPLKKETAQIPAESPLFVSLAPVDISGGVLFRSRKWEMADDLQPSRLKLQSTTNNDTRRVNNA